MLWDDPEGQEKPELFVGILGCIPLDFGERIFNNFFHRKTTEMQIYFTKELTEWLWLIMELWEFSFRLGLNMENFAAVIPCVSPPVGF